MLNCFLQATCWIKISHKIPVIMVQFLGMIISKFQYTHYYHPKFGVKKRFYFNLAAVHYTLQRLLFLY